MSSPVDAIAFLAKHAAKNPGLSTTLEGIGKQPGKFIKGYALDFPLELLKGLGQTGLNAVQTVSPVPIPGASDEFYEYKGALPNPTNPADLLALGQRIYRMSNIAGMGIPDATVKNTQRMNLQNPPESYDDYIMNAVKGLVRGVGMDVLPGNELKSMLTGEVETGLDAQGNPITRPITPEETGKMSGMAVAKALPAAGIIGKLQRKIGKPLTPEYSPHKTVSIGEIDAAKATAKGGLAEAGSEAAVEGAAGVKPSGPAKLPSDIQTIVDSIPAEARDQVRTQRLLSSPEVRQTVNRAAWTRTFEQLQEEHPNSPTFHNVVRAVARGEVDPDVASRISEAHGIPLNEVPQHLAAALAETTSFGGQVLQPFSEVSRLYFADLARRANTGDLSAIKIIRNMKRMKQQAQEGGSPWSKFINLTKGWIETPRRGLMVGQMATGMRNLQGQGLTALTNMFEDGIVGVLRSVTDHSEAGRLRSIGDYYGDLAQDFHAFVSELRPEQRAQLTSVMEAFPLNRQRMMGAAQFDIGSDVLMNAVRGRFRRGARPEGQEWVQLGVEANPFMLLNRIQEIEFRRMAFQSRLMQNLEGTGITTLEQLLEEAKKPTLREDVRFAVANAEEHALKQTYAYVPETGFAQGVMNLYKAVDKITGGFSTALLPPFPRFLINQYRWQMEHSPSLWFNIFDKKFRDSLIRGADGMFAQKEAARQLARATTGLLHLNAAWGMRNSDSAGPKYYQYQLPGMPKADEQGNPVYADIRPFQPFASMHFLAAVVKSIQDGTPLNLDSNELTDAIAGVRRLGEVPMFALADTIRSLDSSDPKTFEKAVKTQAGQYFASFFTPLRTLEDLYGGIANDSAAKTMRDVRGNELVGPAMTAIPGLASQLPARVSPYTGQAIESFDPIRRQLTGVNLTPMTPLQKLVEEHSTIKLDDLVGKLPDARSFNAVAEQLGQMISQKTPNGPTVGEAITSGIRSKNLPPADEKQFLLEIFSRLRSTAKDRTFAHAMSTGDRELIRSIVKSHLPDNTPPSLKPFLIRKIDEKVNALTFPTTPAPPR